MKKLLWLSLIPLTAFWQFSVDIYGLLPSLPLAASSILLGIAFSVLGFWKSDTSFDKRYGAILFPLILSSFVIPYPYNAGLIVSAAGFLIAMLASRSSTVWLGTIFAGAVLILDSLALSIYNIIAPNYHSASWLAGSIAYLLRLTGLDSAENGGMVFVFSQDKVFPFTVTLEKLGLYPWILIFVGSLLIIFLISESTLVFLKRSAFAFTASLVYLVLRYVILVHVFFYSDLPIDAQDRLAIFIDPWWIILSFAPLVLLFLLFDVPAHLKLDFSLSVDKRLPIALAAVLLSVFCLTSAAVFWDGGTKKDGRVLVDEIHSIWEFSTLKLDKNWYGENSTYNAYSMIEWLKNTYHVDRIVSPSYKIWSVPGAQKVIPDIISDSLTYDILKNYDILIIKTPSRYQPAEVDAIVRFVENGGGLFLIGDHTNFAGTGTNLNQISKSFGIEFGFDAVNTMNGTLYYYKRGQLSHPIVKYMPNLDFMTGCSLKVPPSGESVICGFGLRADPGEFASVGFFRETRSNDPTQATDTVWGLINQAVAVRYGKGRVVAFADSTIISNFRIFFGGSPNFVIGAMEYLNRKNFYENEKQILLILGLVIACLAAYLMGRITWGNRKFAALLAVLAIGALSASGALLIFTTNGKSTIPSEFYFRNHTVGFDGEHSDMITNQGALMGQYETFFVWTQRVNLTPSMENRMDDAMAKGRALVVIDPVKPLSQEGLASMQNYIKDGDSVLLMVSSEGPWSDVISYFGMQIYQIEAPTNTTNPTNTMDTSLNTSVVDGLPIKPWGMAIKGGRALLTIEGRVVLAEASYGKGKFLLFTDSQVFKDGFFGRPGYMGYSKTDPGIVDKKNYDLKALYDLEYRIFEDYLKFYKNGTTNSKD